MCLRIFLVCVLSSRTVLSASALGGANDALVSQGAGLLGPVGSLDELLNLRQTEGAPKIGDVSKLCNTVDPNNTGICVRPGSCKKKSIGSCDNLGTGECCKVTHGCGTLHGGTVSYFQNKNYPENQKEDLYCASTIVVQRKVCQLRLDFIDFVLPAPDVNGVCNFQNNLNIKNPSSPRGILGVAGNSAFCGTNTRNHLYMPATPGDLVVLTVILNGLTSGVVSSNAFTSTVYKWNVKVTQVECDSSDKFFRDLQAPLGCSQYFTESQGEIISFNYDGNSRIAPDQEYSVCIRSTSTRASGIACSVTLRSISFGMPVGGQDIGVGACPSGAVGEHQCCTDSQTASLGVLTRPTAASEAMTLRRYHCGNTWHESVTSFKPFSISVFVPTLADGPPVNASVPAADLSGFYLQYNVNPGPCL